MYFIHFHLSSPHTLPCSSGSVILLVVQELVIQELLHLLRYPPLLCPLYLQLGLFLLSLIDLHSSEAQAQDQGLQCQDVEEQRDIVQRLEGGRDRNEQGDEREIMRLCAVCLGHEGS